MVAGWGLGGFSEAGSERRESDRIISFFFRREKLLIPDGEPVFKRTGLSQQ